LITFKKPLLLTANANNSQVPTREATFLGTLEMKKMKINLK